MVRGAKRIVLVVVAVAVVVSMPVLWIEVVCMTRHDAKAQAPRPLVNERGYERRESDSYLSFPEWHIVYAYEDLAGVLSRGDESDFAYGRQIAGFWRSLCNLNRVVTSRGVVGRDTKVMLYTIGWSFTAELALQGRVASLHCWVQPLPRARSSESARLAIHSSSRGVSMSSRR